MLVLGWSGTAAAEKKRVGVPKFDGPQEAIIRRAVMQALTSDGYDVVGGKELDATARAAGAELDSNEGFKSVAKELSISAFVAGEVGKKKAKLTVRNGADGALSGEGSFGGANPAKIAGDVKENFSRRLGSAVARGRAPAGAKKPTVAAAPPPADDDESDAKSASKSSDEDNKGDKADKSDSKADSSKSDSASEAAPAADTASAETTVAKTAAPAASEDGAVGPRALDLQVGLRGFSRSLTYNQDYFHGTPYQLRDYSLTLGPAIGLHLLTYPASFFTTGIATAFGVELNVDYAFGVASNVKAPTVGTVGTSVHDFNGGVRARMMLGAHELSAFLGGGEHAFVFKSTSSIDRTALDIPDTIYRYVRVGADARLQLAPGFSLDLDAAYRFILNRGGDQPLQIAYLATDDTKRDGYFPYLKVGAVDASATLGYQITPSIEARLGVDVRRYFMAMNSSAAIYKADGSGGDLNAAGQPVNKVAGGAVDQYVGITIGAAYIFGGVAPGAAREEATSEEPPAEEAAPHEEATPPKKHKKKKKGDDDDEAAKPKASEGDADE